jgi:lytic cellulose monooxygenase (C1-hydroxylating)
MFKNLVIAACLIASAAAHATWQEIWVNGVDMGDACVRLPQSNNPVTDVTSDARDSTPYHKKHDRANRTL